MGLGKTVMTIALILTRLDRNSLDTQELIGDATINTDVIKKRNQEYHADAPFKPKGGTLIVCPMALLSQWKVNLTSLILSNMLKKLFSL